MTIPTSKLLTDFSGEPLKVGEKTLSVGEAIANVLSFAEAGGKFKLFTLAQKAYGNVLKDIDEADLALIKQSVEASTAYNNLVLGQILSVLETVKEKKEKDAG